MDRELARSFRYCERLARREAGNFYPAFRILPAAQRRAMCALYAFLRVTDDLSDEPGTVDGKRAALADWRCRLDRALAGEFSHPLHAAFAHTTRQHCIPSGYFHEVIDGVEMDLEPARYDQFSDLYKYCYRVASVVGLACIHVWGFHGERAKELAVASGIAFQLTNILRDLGEDAGRGRVYLPQEDLGRFGYCEEQLFRSEQGESFRALMRFEVERARGYYEAARPLARQLDPPGRAVFLVLTRTYRGLLEAIEKRDYDVYTSRVRLSPLRKVWLVLQALPVRWDWL